MLSSRRCVLATFLALLPAGLTPAQTPATTSFTYQGELASSGTPASGIYDLRFRLFDAPSGGSQVGPTLCSDDLGVSAGRFATTLDFGPTAFNGQKRFLEIEVRTDAGQDCSDPAGFTLLAPRQELTAAPLSSFALTAGSAATASNALSLNGQPSTFFTSAANLTGTLPAAVLPSNVARTDANQTFTGQLTLSNPANIFTGNGTGLTNLSGTAITRGTLVRTALSSEVTSGLGTMSLDWALTQTLASAATGTSPKGVAISGRHAFVVNAGAATLQVFDISNPASPVLVSTTPTAPSPAAVAVTGTHAHIVSSSTNTLQIFDISTPATPALVGSTTTGEFPTAIAAAGSRTYVLNRTSSTPPLGTLQTFDTSNPTAPILVRTAQTGASPLGLAISSSHAFVACALSGSLEVFDLQAPSATTSIASVLVGTGAISVAHADGYAFVVGRDQSLLHVVDVRTPSAPAVIGSAALGPLPRAVTISGTHVFITELYSRSLRILDIRNPVSPVLVGTYATGDGPESIAVSGNTILVANAGASTLQILGGRKIISFDGRLDPSVLSGVSGAGLTSITGSSISPGTLARNSLAADVTDGLGTRFLDWSATQPAGSVSTAASPSGLAAAGSNAFVVSSTTNTLQIFNVDAPSAPTLTGSIATAPAPSAVAVAGSQALVVSTTPGTLQVFDVTNPASPSLTGSVSTGSSPSAVTAAGSYAYVTNFSASTLQIFNISTPASPTLISTTSTGGGPVSVAVVEGKALVVNGLAGTLQIFDISNASTPTLLGSVSIASNLTSVATSGTLAFVVCRGDGRLRVVDFSNAATPVIIGNINIGAVPFAVAVSGAYALVTELYTNTLKVVDISAPASPTIVASLAVAAEPRSVAISADRALVASRQSANLLRLSARRLLQFDGFIAPAALSGISGAGLTNLNASSITTGTLSTSLLPASVARTDTANTFGNFINTFTGNVGIGTATPSRPLSFGTALTDKIALYDATNDFWGFGITTGALQIKTGNNERMRITNSGVSIGTTATPTKALEVYGAGNINGLRVRGDNNTSFSMGRGSTDEFEIGIASGFGNFSNFANSGDTILRTIAATPGKIHLQGGPNNAALTISGTQVGINTPNPTNALTVAGNMNVTGSVAKGGGSFKIDHPLDPENKYLYHSFVESPDMMNVYNGNIVTDANGYATITLPDYFEALNRDFRYQLTVVGEDVPDVHFARVFREIKDNSFVVKTTPGNLKVSWQVTGIRQDAWAQKNRIPNAVDKTASEKGKLLHPEAFGKPAAQGIHPSQVPASPAATSPVP